MAVTISLARHRLAPSDPDPCCRSSRPYFFSQPPSERESPLLRWLRRPYVPRAGAFLPARDRISSRSRHGRDVRNSRCSPSACSARSSCPSGRGGYLAGA